MEEEDIANGRTSFDFLYDLEDEALRITDNWEEPIVINNGRCRRKCWTPSGRIQVSEITGNIRRRLMPAREIKIRARRWFTTKVDYTDRNGNYRIEAFRRSVNYSIAFSTQYAKITNYLGVGTFHNGPKMRSSWNVNFEDNVNHKNWVRATLVNAAHEFKQQYQRTGIYNPYPTDYWAGGQGEALNKLNIRAVFKEGTGDMWVPRLNKIRIWTEFTRGRGRKETDDLYAVTFHELGHSSHYKMTKWNITFADAIITESWANFIELDFISQYYPAIADNMQNYHWDRYIWDKTGGESKDEKDRWKYTALFEDLRDDNNQPSTTTIPRFIRPHDEVRNYTIRQLQSAVEKSRKLEHIRDYLKSHYNNPTEGDLDALFDFYISVELIRKI